MMNKSWFKSWFDTKHYHILYKHRDYKEAEVFIQNLVDYLEIGKSSNILDVACGKGRHSYFLAKLGYNVTGIDLSKESIAWAIKSYNLTNLNFDVHDMREPYRENYFDYVLNLFTSFGYFESSEENQQVIHAMGKNLGNNGTIVIDFMNSVKVIQQLVKDEVKTIDNITFRLNRSLINGEIVKDIHFEDDGQTYHFQERVDALTLSDFKQYAEKASLRIEAIFGDYFLTPFHEQFSDRLIMILKKC